MSSAVRAMRRGRRRVLTGLASCSVVAACGQRAEPGVLAPRSGVFLLGDASDDFERAIEPRELVFPDDHGGHEGFRSEWWYFTGNLFDPAERHFGFELTFFRFALTPGRAARASAWASNQAWMAHFAITDSEARRFHAVERFARGALDLAGARSLPLRIWVKDWSAEAIGAEAGRDAVLALRLEASDREMSLGLDLAARRSPIAHGRSGLSVKGPEPGNASYYYSVPRLAAQGSVETRSGRFDVEGLVWLDREWGTSALPADVRGWDWFALHLSDGTDVMFYRLRRSDGWSSPFSGGSWIEADGGRVDLGWRSAEIVARRYWRSPRTGVRYPLEWVLRVPEIGLELDISPRLEDQELDLTVRYWEGAVVARGVRLGQPVIANGYVELVGY